jgi:hypothetical protein
MFVSKIEIRRYKKVCEPACHKVDPEFDIWGVGLSFQNVLLILALDILYLAAGRRDNN